MGEIWKSDFEAAGYKPFRDHLKDTERHRPEAERFYQGSMQKRVRDERGTRYFVNVDFWDMAGFPGSGVRNRSHSAHVQFSVRDEIRETVNVEGVTRKAPAETEAFFADVWSCMGWGYYEVDDHDAPAPSLSAGESGR